MAGEIQQSYGLSKNLFISRKTGGESLVIGGIAEDSTRWTRVLSQRAAQILWFHLSRYLFPEKAELASAMIMTAAIRSTDMPTITSHMTVDQAGDGEYNIVGWINDHSWSIRLDNSEAQQFWTALDTILYPSGWQVTNKKQD